jgi:hypothetical protein
MHGSRQTRGSLKLPLAENFGREQLAIPASRSMLCEDWRTWGQLPSPISSETNLVRVARP